MESIRETLERAGGVPESARVAIDGGVDAAVQTVSKQVAIAAEHVSGYAGVARAHADAASVRFREYEDRLFRTPTATVARLVTTCPYQTAGVALGASFFLGLAMLWLFRQCAHTMVWTVVYAKVGVMAALAVAFLLSLIHI